MEGFFCQFPGCDLATTGRCDDCHGHFCRRHIWQAWYGAEVALCAACHQRLAADRRERAYARARAGAAYMAIVVVLLLCSAIISYSLHGLRHMDPVLTKWMFWLSVAGFFGSLNRLGVLIARIRRH